MSLDNPNTKEEKKDLDQHHKNLREEANQPIDDVPVGEPTKKTQIIAIYGKGGIGKSFTLFLEKYFIKGLPIKKIIMSEVTTDKPILNVMYLKTFKNENVSTKEVKKL